MATVTVSNINGDTIISQSKSNENANFEHVVNAFQMSEVIEQSNPIQCYINEDNIVSFINNNNAFTNENGDVYYACLTSAADANQQDQILQLIPQNQLSNFILTNKEFRSVNFVNEPSIVNANHFFKQEPLTESLKQVNKQYCSVCSVSFPSKRAYLKHMSIHENDREFKCGCCKMSYNHEINLLVHIAIIHPSQCSLEDQSDANSKYRCLVCSLNFSREKALQGHCLIHQVDEELICDQCSAPFKSRILLDKHINDHNINVLKRENSNGLHCKICQQRFENAGHIKRHYKQFHPKIKSWTEEVSDEKGIFLVPKNDDEQNVDPSNKRKSSKIASQTIKLYAQGKSASIESSTEFGEGKRRGRPRKSESSLSKSSKNDVTCSICQRTFKTPILLRRHEVTHTGIKEFECHVCKKRFTQKSSVKIHMVVHENVKAFNCKHCHKVFTYEHNMNTHIKTVHRLSGSISSQVNNQGLQCDIDQIEEPQDCINNNPGEQIVKIEDGELSQYLWQDSRNVYVPSTPDLVKVNWDKTHQVTEQLGILLSEDVEKVDKETGQLQSQEVIRDHVTGFKRFRCQVCKKLFRKSCDLSRHARIHSGQRPFKCYLCRKSFRLKSVLKNHFKSHWKLKEFSCDICSKSFNLKQTLKVHSRLHNSSEMKFFCQACDKKFNSSFHYKYHCRTHHQPQTVAPNNVVFIENMEPLLLDNNLMTNGKPEVNRPFKCSMCTKSYKLEKYLREHLKEHGNMMRTVCSYCQKSFLTLRSLQQHLRTQHINRRNFVCQQCPATFILKASLIRHGLVHSNSKPYACPLCFRRFKAKIYADRHINLQKCTKRPSTERPAQMEETTILHVSNDINKIGCNIESEILQSEQASGPYCNFQLLDLDMNTSQASNILVTNYVTNGFQTFGGSEKYMVVSLDSNNKPGECYYDNQIMEHHENMVGLLETEMGVNPAEIGAIYGYGNNNGVGVAGGDSNNNNGGEPIQQENVYYYEEAPKTVGTLADKFPILKATLFSDDEDIVKSKQTVFYQAELHHPSKIFHGCANCTEEFPDSQTLVAHVRSRHQVAKEFVCSVCHKSFSADLSLWAHSKIHSEQSPDFLACIACDQRFVSVPSLSRHVRMQHNDTLNLYRCVHCNRLYKTVRELDAHVKQLTADYDALVLTGRLGGQPRAAREVRDPSISKDFLVELQSADISHIASLDVRETNKLSMQELIRAAKETVSQAGGPVSSSSRRRPTQAPLASAYSCAVCHKGFSRASNLQQHLSVHTGAAPHQCAICGRRFRHRCSLRTHEVAKHSAVTRLLRCHLCLRLLRSQVALRSHMRRHLRATAPLAIGLGDGNDQP